MNPYIKLQNRKRTWTPVQPTKGVLKEGAEDVEAMKVVLRDEQAKLAIAKENTNKMIELKVDQGGYPSISGSGS